jgi:hypothetical protein
VPWDAVVQPGSSLPKLSAELDHIVRADQQGHVKDIREKKARSNWLADRVLVRVYFQAGHAKEAAVVIARLDGQLNASTDELHLAYVAPRILRDLAGEPSVQYIDISVAPTPLTSLRRAL